MSRPLKLKATGACLSAFELPDLGFIGQFAGAHRRHFPARDGGVILALFSNQGGFHSDDPIDRAALSAGLPAFDLQGPNAGRPRTSG